MSAQRPVPATPMPMPPHVFTSPAGARYDIRVADPADEPALVRMLERLHPEEIRMRFFMPMHSFLRMAHLMLEDDERRHFAFVATPAGAPGEIIATAMLAVLRDRASAEFALVVHHAHARRGLGAHLMQCLLAAARDHGIPEVFGIVLQENQPMLNLARRAGFALGPDPECPGALRVVRREAPRQAAA